MNQTVRALLHMFGRSDAHVGRATAIAERIATPALEPSTIAGRALGEAAAEGGDLDILNYALTLEHFENAMYRTIIASGLLTGTSLAYATTYGDHENTHVIALRDTITALGGTPVAELDRYNFPQVTTAAEVISLLVTVEDVGASAYLGAAPLITNGDLLTVGVQIHTVEAEHATVWRYVAGQDPVPFSFATPRTIPEVLAIVTPLLRSPRVYLPAIGLAK